MSDSRPVVFDVLTKDNYNTWRMQAEALLEVSNLWDYVKKDKESIPEDVKGRESWMKKDKIAKSKLILHISSSLLPLIEDCLTSREVWLKLANVYGNRSNKYEDSIDDEDTIINDIETSVCDFFDIINYSSEKKLTEDKKSLSKIFTDNLFLQLKINNIKKLPDAELIVNTISDFIDVIDKLTKTELNKKTSELRAKLIDILLVKFNINPCKYDSDEVNSSADEAETRDSQVDDEREQENSEILSELIPFDAPNIAASQSETISQNEALTDETRRVIEIYNRVLRSKLQLYNERMLYESHDQQGCEYSMTPFINQYTPPSTPSPKKTYKCGVCREEGHNRTTCPLNKSTALASKFSAKITTTPKRSTNKPAAYVPKSADQTCEAPKRPNKCGVCGIAGHNRTTCPLNKPSKYTAPIPETPKRSYTCGACGNQGHNIRSCPLMKSTIPSPRPSAIITPVRTYTCGLCGGEGHNRRTCPLNSATPAKTYRCGTCGGAGHNSRTCGRHGASATPSYGMSYSYPSPAPSSSGSGRSYSCSICGGAGHNSRTCGRRETSSSSSYTPSYSNSSRAPPSSGSRRYSCGICGGSGHNRRTCSG